MARYHLHARLFVGTLAAPERNETRTAYSDDRGELEATADELRERGWRVWLYEELAGRNGSLEITGRPTRLHVLQEWREVKA